MKGKRNIEKLPAPAANTNDCPFKGVEFFSKSGRYMLVLDTPSEKPSNEGFSLVENREEMEFSGRQMINGYLFTLEGVLEKGQIQTININGKALTKE